MRYELIAIVLTAVLPIYPALFVIYHKIGKDDVICEEYGKVREDHDRIQKGKDLHGSVTYSDSLAGCYPHRRNRGILAALGEDQGRIGHR